MLPKIGITMGDPFGNGPELTVKALNHKELYEKCIPIVYGDSSCLEYALKVSEKVNNIKLKLNIISNPDQAKGEYGTIDIIDFCLIDKNEIPEFNGSCKPLGIGPTKIGGEASFQYVKRVIEDAVDGRINATCTNALCKEGLNETEHKFSGHTEIFAHYTNTNKYAMMLVSDKLRVIHVSTHVSLREACDRVKKDRVLEVIRIANRECKTFGIKIPKIAVAGLNPHCGENGLFGKEEIEEIQPAIDEAISEGINIPDGRPIPPDTVFSKAVGGWYDVVVCMYHDQGHIPTKTLGFVYNESLKKWDAVKGVNITLGLPIIRTSVDHGTGFDTAGDGSASELSLLNAVDYAITMANNKN